MSNIIIIADDLTGANDTGVQFSKNGFKTFVAVNYSNFNCCDFSEYNAISINADSRILNSNDAYERVYSIASKFNNMNFDLMYKKIDSIMRGNPGIELDSMMDAIEADIAIVTPSFPATNRIVKDGFLYVDNDLKNKNLFVPEILQKEMKRKVENISLDMLRGDEDKLIENILSSSKIDSKVFVIDAISDEDIAKIARISKRLSKKLVLCGSAGLAQQVSKTWNFKTNSKKNRVSSKKGVVLLVVGSRNLCTASQVENVINSLDAALIKVEIRKVIENSRKTINDIVKDARGCIENKALIVLAVDSLFNADKEYLDNLKFDSEDNGEAQAIVNALGEIVREIYCENDISAIIATGGDTSMQICSALEAKGIYLINEIIAGIPAGKLIGGLADDLYIVTKSGGFGSDDALVNVINHLYSENIQLLKRMI